jgi:hypothetical protein
MINPYILSLTFHSQGSLLVAETDHTLGHAVQLTDLSAKAIALQWIAAYKRMGYQVDKASLTQLRDNGVWSTGVLCG